MFGIRTGDAIDRTKLADPIGRTQRRHAANSAIAIRGIGSIELVATANPAQLVVGGDGVIYGKGEVACDAENIPDADLLQASKNVLNDSFAHIHSNSPVDGGTLVTSFLNLPFRVSNEDQVVCPRLAPVIARTDIARLIRRYRTGLTPT